MRTRQIVITDDQDKALKKLSYDKGVSVSTLIRVALIQVYNIPESDFTNLPDDFEELKKLNDLLQVERPE